MHINLNPGGDLPIYRQIMNQVTDSIVGGQLAPDEKLPSHRELAVQAVISHLTVKKAYDELEREGWIRTKRGRGTFVASTLPSRSDSDAAEELRESAHQLLVRARTRGVGIEELVDLLRGLQKEEVE